MLFGTYVGSANLLSYFDRRLRSASVLSFVHYQGQRKMLKSGGAQIYYGHVEGKFQRIF